MEKKFTIYIDHAWAKNENDGIFAQKIKDRIKTIKQDFSISTFGDLEHQDDESWENRTINAIDDADIVIPIITADYLSFISPIESKFDEINDSENRYLFPILYKPANWSSYKSIVKSKLIPEDNFALSEKKENEVDKIINELVNRISEIIANNSEVNFINFKKITSELSDKLVFISHDHEDGDFAELLKLQLEKNGINGWIDSERLKIGQDWREEIDESITNSLAVIAIMTPESRKSEYVTYEWAFAWGKGKKKFPLMLKQTQLHPRLESLQYLDFTKRNSRPFDKLIDSLKELL